MSKKATRTDRNTDGQPRDGKRTHRAKSKTITLRQQRALKARARTGN